MQNATRKRSFLPKSIMVVTALGLITVLGSYKAAATDVVTDPVGFITLTAYGTSGASGKSYLGLGMTQIPTNVGLVSAVSGLQATLSSPLPNGGFNKVGANAAYFITVTTGSVAGVMSDIVSNNGTSVFTSEALPAASVGQNYEIIPHWTIASVFGPNDESGLQKGNASTADLIQIFNPVTQAYAPYYYAVSSKTVTAGWKDSLGNDAAATTMYIDQGFLIQKATTTNLTVKLVGAVKLGPTVIPLGANKNYVGNVYASGNMTLGTSMLYNGGNPTNSLVAGNASTADLVQIYDSVAGSYSPYYYATSSKTVTAGWKNSLGGDATNVQIPLGRNILIQIIGGRTGFDWTPAAPY